MNKQEKVGWWNWGSRLWSAPSLIACDLASSFMGTKESIRHGILQLPFTHTNPYATLLPFWPQRTKAPLSSHQDCVILCTSFNIFLFPQGCLFNMLFPLNLSSFKEVKKTVCGGPVSLKQFAFETSQMPEYLADISKVLRDPKRHLTS